ncbi:MAG: aminomethyl-transferring glycine dehydrogenase [Ignavibacteriales bacterium]|nr:aminomethyl-transferring glycine dehydrogenase [Ignavibacteriales bacterium]
MNHSPTEQFAERHIGPRPDELESMLKTVGAGSLEELIDQTIPSGIRQKEPLQLPEPMSEHSYLEHLRAIARKNDALKSCLGQGFYGTVTPSVLRRNVFENPGWYTQYTPYQAEISQGRLEALLNYQTMIIDLTGMEVANASLLDEGTAAAEAMSMMHGIVSRGINGSPRNKFFVSEKLFVQTIEVLRTRALPLDINLVVGNHESVEYDRSFFGALLQYPDADGAVFDYEPFIGTVHKHGGLVAVAADLLSLALLKPPGEFGADVVVGNSQRFGVPMGFGGPHAGYFATNGEHIRTMPGRIIGVSIDAHGKRAYRMTLQTREQHIRREKATSNICTAQALLAVMAGMFGVYHGPNGLRRIASRVHRLTRILESELVALGYNQLNDVYFDTIRVSVPESGPVLSAAAKAGYNLRAIDKKTIGISLDETTTAADVIELIGVFAAIKKVRTSSGNPETKYSNLDISYPKPLERTSAYLQHPVFNSHHSETEMMRYLKKLENRDLSLMHSMIPLGSCTMKLNAATELLPVSWPEFANVHPFAPLEQTEGYRLIFSELEKALCEITGLAAASLQPNSGAQGEFTGLMVIRAHHRDHGQPERTVTLIPASAHGTNPASAVMAGMNVVVVNCDEMGNIDVDDLRGKAELHKKTLAALMVTYPSTYGIFEERIREICDIVHENGGFVYMDGANLNAQVGLTSPAIIGADVCHINLHKTFAIPHGGGGPGMGPICVTRELAPYLPGHPLAKTGGSKAIPAVAATPWGSSSILLISYGYIRMLGARGLTASTQYAILNANYLKSKLEHHYPALYQGRNGRVGHEFILNMKAFKDLNVDVEDIAKRLMDYGFHAPTVSFPLAGVLMIEPTESEPKGELDRFVEAMRAIRLEIQEIAEGKADHTDNVLKNAPHTAAEAVAGPWNHRYSREKAVFPVDALKENKFWIPVGRINNTYGDRNLFCSCPPIESYSGETLPA